MRNINIAVPEELHRQFKAQASTEGLTLKEFMIRSATAALRPKGGKKP